MQDLRECYNYSLFSGCCEVSQGKYSPYIKIQEANEVLLPCENPFGKNIITCKNIYKNEFLEEVDGLKLDLNCKLILPTLPSYLPIYDKSKIYLGEEFIGITLIDILKKGIVFRAGMLHEQEIILNEKVLQSDIYKDKKVILFLTGSDTLIEWLWYERDECNLFERLKQMGFYAICGFNFSVIGGECAFAQALNQKRSLFSTVLAAKNGLSSIPHVYALNKYHVARWIEWFKLNPFVNYFVTNCQLQKSTNDINQVIAITKEILIQSPNLSVILQGFPLNRISDFEGFLHKVHFADKGAIKYAHSKTKLYHNLEKNVLLKQENVNDSFGNLVINNVRVKRNFIEYNKQIFRNIKAA